MKAYAKIPRQGKTGFKNKINIIIFNNKTVQGKAEKERCQIQSGKQEGL